MNTHIEYAYTNFSKFYLFYAAFHLNSSLMSVDGRNSERCTWMVTIAMLKNRLELRVNVEVSKINEGETNNEKKWII